MPRSADLAPSRNGLTLMSVTSTEISAAARHLWILISASAASRLWFILEVACADAQREVIARCSKDEERGGEAPV